MRDPARIKPVPWDSAAFGFDCYEIIDPDPAVVGAAITQPGHYTAKVDPLADKLLVTAALISLVQLELAPAWMAAVILGRELSVTVLRSMSVARGVAMPASPLGKLKLISQVVAILALILSEVAGRWLWYIGTAALWVATGTALVSGVDYYRKFTSAMNRP